MAASKRAQARNERMLQDLIRTVPGNDRCADCSAKNPGWASWSLGIFLCMRCAALHRKLGTHITKVKSLSMDSWTTEQVDNMKNVGNTISNQKYNPQNVKPEIPIDIDEAESAIEKHIRQKYELRTLSGGVRAPMPASRQNTGSTGTGSWSEEPPALPPKPSKKFGFSLRSASSTFPRQKADRFTPPISPARTGSDLSADLASTHKANKPSQMFGMKITTVDNNFNEKLARLREMGFGDNKKNTDMLKSLNGDLEKTIEALARLGDGGSGLRSATPGSRTLTPVSMGSSGVNGLTVEKRREPEKKPSNNPWDIPEQPQRSVTQPPPSTFPEHRAQSVPPASASWNPFLSQTQQNQPPMPALENSFQSLQVSHTGPAQSYVNQQPQYQENALQQNNNNNPWQIQQQPTAAPQYGQQYQQPPSMTQNNPFMPHQQVPQSFTASNPWAQQPQQSQQQVPATQQPNNPFGTSWQQQNIFQQPTTASPAPVYGQQADFFSPPQAQQSMQQPTQPQPQFQPQQQQYPVGGSQNPWLQQMTQQQTGAPQQQQQQMYQQQPQQYGQYSAPPPARHDKSSILALYGQAPLAAQRTLQTLPEDGTLQAAPVQHQVPQRSATMPVMAMPQQPQPGVIGSMNPFAPANAPGARHVSNESVDFQGFAANGRHSPDAFSGLSARYMR